MTMGVAISATGQMHRQKFLETTTWRWCEALPKDAPVFVTVDGSDDDARRVAALVRPYGAQVFRVGQIDPGWGVGPVDGLIGDRLGVAANKNTGIELLMNAGVDELFLSDDDCYPLMPQALTKHVDFEYGHSMVMWGGSRLDYAARSYAAWKWPRGVMLHARRDVIQRVGGFDERLVNAHEHAEWSIRIHDAGLTAEPFVSPRSYAERGVVGSAYRASALWHCEDMRRTGETLNALDARRKAITSIDRAERDWDLIHSVMAERAGKGEFVAYRADLNGRASATIYPNEPSRGADE